MKGYVIQPLRNGWNTNKKIYICIVKIYLINIIILFVPCISYIWVRIYSLFSMTLGRWTKIAAHVPGRSDNMCWRRWKAIQKEEVVIFLKVTALAKSVLLCYVGHFILTVIGCNCILVFSKNSLLSPT